MYKTTEERLYLGISSKRQVFCREDEIRKTYEDYFPYYAALPYIKSRKWHKTHDRWTFKYSGSRLVVFQKPWTLNGFPIVEIAEERSVEEEYQRMLMEASHTDTNAILSGYSTKPNKPLTYVFVYELLKYIAVYGRNGWELRRTKDISDITYTLEENFCSEDDLEQHYRNNAPDDIDWDTPSIGCGHGDDY